MRGSTCPRRNTPSSIGNRVRTVAFWLTAPPASMRRDRIRHHDITVRLTTVVLREVPCEALLADPAPACFAPTT